MSVGRAFQKVGASTLKALSPKTGACCQGLVLMRTLVAELWTYWSQSRALLGTPDRTPLQEPKPEVMEAQIRVSAMKAGSDGQSLEMFLR